MTSPLRVGIAGCGIGRSHAAAFAELPEMFRLVAVCDINQEKARDLADLFSIPKVLADFGDLCALGDLDVVDICTPSYLHLPQALKALAAGKHVVLEKPVAGSLQAADALIEAEARSGKRLMPIFQYRFGQGLQRLKLLQERGVTGEALMTTVETHWRRRPEYYAAAWHGKWETELGGALVTLGIHAHDALMYILGPARAVSAQTATLVNPIQTEDSISASLQMADGSLCSLSVTTGSAVELSRFRFCFRNLVAESPTTPYTNTSDPWTFSADSPEKQEQIEAVLAGFQPGLEGFPALFPLFYEAVLEGKPLPVTMLEARRSLELITAIYSSARSGQRVSLPLGKDHPDYAGWQPK